MRPAGLRGHAVRRRRARHDRGLQQAPRRGVRRLEEPSAEPRRLARRPLERLCHGAGRRPSRTDRPCRWRRSSGRPCADDAAGEFPCPPHHRPPAPGQGQMFESGQGIDWATAEALAFGTLLDEGYPGPPVGTGFRPRHLLPAPFRAGRPGKRNALRAAQSHPRRPGRVRSDRQLALSEFAVLGFEYGYSPAEPRALVLWEAQFGDFANGAQVIIDQFIASGEMKWLRMCGLVMLLPHGYEGQGPEHSSARLERYLQLCAQDNIQVAYCTTPANYFHILRRQMHRPFRKPLVLMTPKSLLRHKRCVSFLSDMAPGSSFHRVLRDKAQTVPGSSVALAPDDQIRRVILCTGKVYFDLVEEREKRGETESRSCVSNSSIRSRKMRCADELRRFPKAEIVWCQEEPKNQGAWTFVAPRIEETIVELGGNWTPRYIGRPEYASTAAGLMSQHNGRTARIPRRSVDTIKGRRRRASTRGLHEHRIKVPAMGESVTEATVARWFKKVGDSVARDEPLRRAGNRQGDGRSALARRRHDRIIAVQAGATVQVGTVLGAIAEGAGASRPAPAARAASRTAATAHQPAPPQPAPAARSRRNLCPSCPPCGASRRKQGRSGKCQRHRQRRPRNQGRHAGGARNACCRASVAPRSGRAAGPRANAAREERVTDVAPAQDDRAAPQGIPEYCRPAHDLQRSRHERPSCCSATSTRKTSRRNTACGSASWASS